MNLLLAQPPLGLQDAVCTLWALRGAVEGQYSGLPKPYVELIISLSGTHHWQETKSSSVHSYSKGLSSPHFMGQYPSIVAFHERLKIALNWTLA